MASDKMLGREMRKQKRLERLGTDRPLCGLCGEDDWRCFELHHVAGRKRDATTVILCTNCHRKATDDQKDHPPFSLDADVFLDRIGRFLLGLADLCRCIAEALVRFGEELIERAHAEASGRAVS